MRILITGNLGYLGSVLVPFLRKRFQNACLIGYDSGFFAHCLTKVSVSPEVYLHQQFYGDIRLLPESLLENVDAIIHLAAVSNDPMSNRFEKITALINTEATVRLAKIALAKGVSRFVFASSCSIYGFAEGIAVKEFDPINPLTAYARSKAAAEKELSQLSQKNTTVTALRFPTACGFSPRVRLDLVLNDFVVAALTEKKITVLSDGTPWRPLIHVLDMCRAIEWALIRDPSEAGAYLAVNVGSDEWNFQVRDLAYEVAKVIPGVEVSINSSAPPDKRSYRVDFSLYCQVATGYQPQISLKEAICELAVGLQKMDLMNRDFRSSEFIRLKVLENHISEGRLNEHLFWRDLEPN